MEQGNFWIAVTDLHESTHKLTQIPDADNAAGIIVTGDLTNAGNSGKAERLLEDITAVNPVVYAMMGNMDKRGVQTVLEKRDMSIHAKGIRLGESLGLAGVGCSLPTPFGTPSEVSEETLATWLEQAVSGIEHLPHLILACHNPPWNTSLDRLRSGKHVGSRKLREFIELNQPRVVVTGHIHEAAGEEWIQASQIINPGPLGAGGYALIRQTGDGGLEAELRRVDA